MGRFDLRTRSGLISPIIQSGILIDSDAQAFYDRVTTAGGSLTQNEKDAVNTLVLSLKSTGVWVLMKAIYPMVGASAAACSQNLKSSSFTGTFTSGITYSNNGILGNGTSAYMNTNLNSNSNLISGYNHLSFYSRSSTIANVTVELGAQSSTFNHLRTAVNYVTGATTIVNFTTTSTSLGFWIGSVMSFTSRKVYRNGILENTNTTNDSSNNPNVNLFLLSRNDSGTAAFFSDKQCAFASIGDGLTDTQASNFYTSIQTFQTSLSRQV